MSGQTHKSVNKQCPDKHTKGANKQIDRQKDRLTDYSNFNIDKALQASQNPSKFCTGESRFSELFDQRQNIH